jgi:adenine deaminase
LEVSKQLINAARGNRNIDLVLRNAKLVNVLSGEIHVTDIGVGAGKFVGIGCFAQATRELDLGGKYVVPGLIDAHVHVESSHLCPEEFVSILLAHGVTSAVMDPHEIANVLGTKGIDYMLNSLTKLPFNAFIALPSCVPTTELETSGARLEADDLSRYVGHPNVIGLGEVMNYPGVLNCEAGLLAKLELPLKVKDGHAPGVAPQDLNALRIAGITTDHECSTAEEARERLRRGFYVMLREGSAAKNLLDLLPGVNQHNARNFLLVTDDRHPVELLKKGSIDDLVRMAIKAGQPPLQVIQMATVNAAQAFGLKKLGAVAPGYWADFVVLNDLEKFEIEEVYWRGKLQSSNGQRPIFAKSKIDGLTGSVKLAEIDGNKLALKAVTDSPRVTVRVIGVEGSSLVTKSLVKELPVVDGNVLPDQEQQIAKLVVAERHNFTGRVGIGFVTGLGLKMGAIASSVAHDSHNLIAVGVSDVELELAIKTCAQMSGGICVVLGNQVLGKLPLPIAGLMTDQPAEQVEETLVQLHTLARELGISPEVDPFMTLSFLSLPVIPELKLTDLGLIDVGKHCVVNPLLYRRG